MKPFRVVIVGASIAGHTIATGIKKENPDASVTLVTDEAYPLYDRRKLFDFLCGAVQEKDLMLVRSDTYEKQGIVFLKDHKAVSVAPVRKQLSCLILPRYVITHYISLTDLFGTTILS